MGHYRTGASASRQDRLRYGRYPAAGIALFASSVLAAQMVSIPLGGPRPERPSPNATQLGAPAEIAAAVAAKGRPLAMRNLDETRHPFEVLEFLGLSRGVRVLVVERDLGYYGEIIGAAVGPDGKIAELVPPAAMQDPATRATLSDSISLAPNLSLLAASPASVRFAPNGFDFVLLHRVDERLVSIVATPDAQQADLVAFLLKLFAAVRPGGIVGLVDRPAQSDDGHSDGMTGSDASSIKRDFAGAGFLLDREGRVRGGGDDGRLNSVTNEAIGTEPPGFILRFRKPE